MLAHRDAAWLQDEISQVEIEQCLEFSTMDNAMQANAVNNHSFQFITLGMFAMIWYISHYRS